MKSQPNEQAASDIPANLSAPAKRALDGAGYTQLKHLTHVTEAEVKALHGIGPNAIKMLREALESKGLSFAKDRTDKA